MTIDESRVIAAVRAHLAEGDYVTSWNIVVEVTPAEVDEDTGEVLAPETASVTAYDLNHHSNVLYVSMNGYEVEEVG